MENFFGSPLVLPALRSGSSSCWKNSRWGPGGAASIFPFGSCDIGSLFFFPSTFSTYFSPETALGARDSPKMSFFSTQLSKAQRLMSIPHSSSQQHIKNSAEGRMAHCRSKVTHYATVTSSRWPQFLAQIWPIMACFRSNLLNLRKLY